MFLSVDAPSAPLQYLTDNTRPTKKDISDIYKLHADEQRCRKVLLDASSNISPAHAAIIINVYAASDKLWAEFTSRRMTWGKFNSERQAIGQQARQQQAELGMRVVSQLQNQNQFELEQRQRAIAAMQQWAYQQQVLENQRIAAMGQAHVAAAAVPSRPITCNFNQMGPNSMTCY